MPDMYVKLPKPDEECGHCMWLSKAHSEAVKADIQTIVILSREAMILHLIESHGSEEQAGLPW